MYFIVYDEVGTYRMWHDSYDEGHLIGDIIFLETRVEGTFYEHGFFVRCCSFLVRTFGHLVETKTSLTIFCSTWRFYSTFDLITFSGIFSNYGIKVSYFWTTTYFMHAWRIV